MARQLVKNEGLRHKIITAIPLVMVNLVAVSGQLGWARDHLRSWTLPGQILFALTLESIAMTVAYHAYLAERSNDSAFRLKMASYLCGGIVGLINYSHYAPRWHLVVIALVTGGMSASSPALWSMYSRRISRDLLYSRGLIEGHALRLGMTRWFWHPMRSARVMYLATWEGINEPAIAIEQWESRRRDKELTEGFKQHDIAST